MHLFALDRCLVHCFWVLCMWLIESLLSSVASLLKIGPIKSSWRLLLVNSVSRLLTVLVARLVLRLTDRDRLAFANRQIHIILRLSQDLRMPLLVASSWWWLLLIFNLLTSLIATLRGVLDSWSKVLRLTRVDGTLLLCRNRRLT